MPICRSMDHGRPMHRPATNPPPRRVVAGRCKGRLLAADGQMAGAWTRLRTDHANGFSRLHSEWGSRMRQRRDGSAIPLSMSCWVWRSWELF